LKIIGHQDLTFHPNRNCPIFFGERNLMCLPSQHGAMKRMIFLTMWMKREGKSTLFLECLNTWKCRHSCNPDFFICPFSGLPFIINGIAILNANKLVWVEFWKTVFSFRHDLEKLFSLFCYFFACGKWLKLKTFSPFYLLLRSMCPHNKVKNVNTKSNKTHVEWYSFSYKKAVGN